MPYQAVVQVVIFTRMIATLRSDGGRHIVCDRPQGTEQRAECPAV